MTSKPSTRERILDASLQLFNTKGYAATPVADIAKSLGISTGNLTYHFPAKLDIVTALKARAYQQYGEANAAPRSGAIADTYVEVVRFAMNHAWQNRFLLRDRGQFGASRDVGQPNANSAADVARAHELLQQIQSAGMFRPSLDLDLQVLARSLWIVSRFWMDHLSEVEGLREVTWSDQERGLQHHFAVLFPCLTAAGKREFESAFDRLAGRYAASAETLIDLAKEGSDA